MLHFKLKIHQKSFVHRAPPGPAGEGLIALPIPPSWTKGKERRGGKEGKGRRGRECAGEG